MFKQSKSFVISLLLAESTAFKLKQTGAPAIPTAVFVSDTGIPHLKGADYNPGASKMDPNALVWQRTAIHDGKVHGEKEHQENANDLQAYGAKQEDVANARLPYASTLLQMDTPAKVAKDDQGLPWVSGADYNPGASKMDPNATVWQRTAIHDGKVHGEKEHQENANDLQAYGAKQEDVANARIPYASTLLQITGAPAIPTSVFVSETGIPHLKGADYNPGASSMDPNAKVWQRAAIHDGKVHGEKEHQENANDLQAYGAKQEDVANARIPYASTLLQMDTPAKVAKDDQGLPWVSGADYNPGASTMDPNAKVWQRTAIHDGKVHGEKEHQENANDLQAYGAKQEDVANARIPYASTLLQMDTPAKVAKDDQGLPWVSGADYNPGASSMDPNAKVWQRTAIHDGKVHGEKEHQENANDLQAYGAKQEDVANARIPYASTLLQMSGAPAIPTSVFVSETGIPHLKGADYNPGASSMDPNASVWQRKAIHDGKVHGEKEHQENANDLQAYGAKQEDVANARIPYASTLLQMSGAPAIPTSVFVSETGIPHLKGADYNPGASSMDPNAKVWQRTAIHDGKVHGEKEHQENANDLQAYGAKQEDVANARLPYASTLQLKDEEPITTGDAGETFTSLGQVPINYKLMQMKDEYYVDDDFNPDDEPETIEVSSDVPHDFKFVHIMTSEGELMRMKDDPINLIETMPTVGENVPLNFGFVHLQNQYGDDIMRYV